MEVRHVIRTLIFVLSDSGHLIMVFCQTEKYGSLMAWIAGVDPQELFGLWNLEVSHHHRALVD